MIEELDATAEEEQPSISLDKLTEVYIKIRDTRQAKARAFDAEDKLLEEQLLMIEGQMLEICKQNNASSIRTESGTVIRQVKSRYWTNDWDSMYSFIQQNNAFGLLEKRLHQTHMKEFLSENPDKLPMGLNVEREYTITVRRSS
jgi:hypothetical protein